MLSATLTESQIIKMLFEKNGEYSNEETVSKSIYQNNT